ncbi:DUF982 domain-containing protein [Rhizobium herbae]
MSCQFPTIWVLTGVGERYKPIDSVIAAAELLLGAWPSAGGKAYLRALQACLDALQDSEPVGVVPGALMLAADEAFVSYIRVVSDTTVGEPMVPARRVN